MGQREDDLPLASTPLASSPLAGSSHTTTPSRMAAFPPPMVTWAQRNNLVFLTVCVEDCEKPEIKVEADSLYFKGTGGPDKKTFEVQMKFFKEIDTEKSKYAVRPRVTEFALEKKEAGPYWDRLLADKTKQHWLKIDFSKWKEEDESDDDDDEEGGQGGQGNLEQMMKNMGGLGGMPGMGGMPDMGGMGGNVGRPSLDDLDAGEDESDDDDLPDLE